MIAVGIIMGTSTPRSSSSFQLLDGPIRGPPRTYLRGSVGKALFRNLNLFNL